MRVFRSGSGESAYPSPGATDPVSRSPHAAPTAAAASFVQHNRIEPVWGDSTCWYNEQARRGVAASLTIREGGMLGPMASEGPEQAPNQETEQYWYGGDKAALLGRLRRIEGQVRGVHRMVE